MLPDHTTLSILSLLDGEDALQSFMGSVVECDASLLFPGVRVSLVESSELVHAINEEFSIELFPELLSDVADEGKARAIVVDDISEVPELRGVDIDP